MGLWGIEVKPGRIRPYHSDNVKGKLRITQATLGPGPSEEKSILQCSVAHKKPFFLCTLLPNKNACCPLDLEFDEDDFVAFSVLGSRSIHLSGYFIAESGDHLRAEYDFDSVGEDIAKSESDESSFGFDTEDEFENYFDDDDDSLLPSPPVSDGGAKTEDIMDDEKPTNGNGKPKKLKKKDNSGDSERQITVKKKAKDSSDHDTTKKRKASSVDQDDQPVRKKNKKKKETGEDGEVKKSSTSEEKNDPSDGENEHELRSDNVNKKDLDSNMDCVPGENNTEKKKKKTRKRKNKKNAETESTQVRTFNSGLIIEELAMGKPGAQRAGPGKQLTIHYTGKLRDTGEVFDSTVGREPYKFRLGMGRIMKRLEFGLFGMCVGDKRRLTIPPDLQVPCYGNKFAAGDGKGVIPPDAWLVYEVELVDAYY